MKDFSLTTLWTIAEELLGAPLLWSAAILAVLVAALFIVALMRRRGFRGGGARAGAIAGAVAGVLVFIAAPFLTQAGYGNLHGVVDWAALGLFAVLAFAGTAAAVYGVLGAFTPPPAG
jgi:hypothetical protein